MGLFSWLKKPKLTYDHKVSSPNGRVVLRVQLKSGQIFYSVAKDGQPLVMESALGIAVRGEKPLLHDLGVVRTHEKSEDNVWETQWGEAKKIRNNYHELAVYLAETSERKRLFTVRFRVFDDGIGLRYEIPPQPEYQRLTIADEITEFRIDNNALAWHIPAYQPDRYEYNYAQDPVYELTHSVHTPLTIEMPSGHFISIHEAALYNYGSMTLRLNKGRALMSDITPLSDGMKAYVELPFNTPWRVIMIADTVKDLTVNRIVLNLNEPPKGDFSWAKPLKFMGIWWAMFVGEWTWAPGPRHGASTAHAKEYIDACERLGIEGLLIEGWNNGWEGDWLKNGDKTSFLKPIGDFDMDVISDYAKEHGVKLIGHHETVGYIDNYERQMEDAYKYYASHGVHYIKPGYAGSMMITRGRKEFHHSQVGVNHYQRALEMAVKYHMMLDVHEPIKGTGIERTFPNMLTREGARGQEYEGGALSPSHATILPFTRLLAGGMDYTSGIFDVTNVTKRIATTVARQLAYYITIYSAMQMAADRPRFYEEEFPEAFRFIRDVPLSFEYTLPLLGRVGEYYVVARKDRESDDWYVGAVTNESSRKIRLDLSFLDAEDMYEAQIYRDGENAHYRDNQLALVVESRRVRKSDFIDVWIAPGGGFAIRLKKI